MRTVFEWDDADVVNHLNQNCHVSGSLKNSNIVVVRGGEHRGPCGRPYDAALSQRPVLWTVEFTSAVRSESLRLSLLPCSRQGWNLPITGIYDQRRSSCFDDLRSSIPPKVVICTTHICLGRAVAAIHVVSRSYLSFVIGSFFFRKEFFACKLGRSLQRRNGCETPDAL